MKSLPLFLFALLSICYGQSKKELMVSGLDKLKAGQNREALMVFKKVQKVDPEYAEAYLMAAYAQQELGMDSFALENLHIATKLNPSCEDCFFAKARSYEVVKNFSKAICNLDTVLMLNPGFQQARYVRALLKMDLNQHTAAIEDFNLYASHEDTLESDLYYKRGVCYYQIKNYQKAFDDLNKFTQIDRSIPYAFFMLSDISYKLKDYSTCIIMVNNYLGFQEKAGNISLKGPALCTKAMALQELGYKEKACESWELSLKAGFVVAKQFIETYCK